MRKNVMYKNIIYTLVTVGCMFLFVMLFCSKASAGSRGGIEGVLRK